METVGQRPDFREPSRAPTIMILVILGWAVCGLLSIASYQMASEDLSKMEAGTMDDTDIGTVRICKTLSLVNLAITALAIIGGCVVGAMSIAGGTRY
jgi:hypothetical protein